MKRVIVGVAVVVAFTLVVLGFALRPVRKVHAQANCTNATLTGAYGAYAFGSTTGHLNNSVAIYVFSGNGTYTSTYWDMVSGSYGGGTQSGTYALGTLSGGGCWGTLTPSGGTGGNIVTASGGNVVYRLDATSGSNYANVLTKQ